LCSGSFGSGSFWSIFTGVISFAAVPFRPTHAAALSGPSLVVLPQLGLFASLIERPQSSKIREGFDNFILSILDQAVLDIEENNLGMNV
jgi:hypothetical protein